MAEEAARRDGKRRRSREEGDTQGGLVFHGLGVGGGRGGLRVKVGVPDDHLRSKGAGQSPGALGFRLAWGLTRQSPREPMG